MESDKSRQHFPKFEVVNGLFVVLVGFPVLRVGHEDSTVGISQKTTDDSVIIFIFFDKIQSFKDHPNQKRAGVSRGTICPHTLGSGQIRRKFLFGL